MSRLFYLFRFTCIVQFSSVCYVDEIFLILSFFWTDNKPKPDLTRSPTFPMYPGESINFICSVDMYSGWEYEWYHKGVKTPSFSSKTITIGSVTHGNKGDYRCLAKRGQFRTDQSDPVSLEVSGKHRIIYTLCHQTNLMHATVPIQHRYGLNCSGTTAPSPKYFMRR